MRKHIYHILLPFLSYFCLFHPVHSQELLSPLVYGSTDGNFHILFEMGDPAQMVFLRIDMSQSASWLTHNVYRPEHSYSGTNQYESSIQIGFLSYDSYIKTETLKIQNKNFNLNNFYFHYLDFNRPEGTYDSLALPYKYSDNKMSLIHQLYNNGALSKKQFSFVPIDDELGYIYLGYLPKDKMEKDNFKKIASCNVDKHYNTWGCNIDKVYIDTNVYASNQYAYFNPTTKETLVPHSFMSFFSETFMREYINNGTCVYRKGYDSYQCDCTKLTNVPIVVIMLGDQSIELSKDVLFRNTNGKCELKLKTNPMNMNWVFGTDFIEQHITTFNYDKGIIDIYSNRVQHYGKFDYLHGGRKLTLVQILIVVTVALFVTLVAGFVYMKVRNCAKKKKMKKRKKKFYNQDTTLI